MGITNLDLENPLNLVFITEFVSGNAYIKLTNVIYTYVPNNISYIIRVDFEDFEKIT